ncbi:Meiotic recombination protein SPO11 [Golovinomyces cichoracearum]|uniref:DNA topoisomerase (ATP-hydrolyzing) n=1 Tax=Golovinomyces cichoracearum TaxID=62708 RepID=A0A420IU00_9PEZI|nr:Meiotic recombination protein SPO11 [Golovinomyces cichoracearum]
MDLDSTTQVISTHVEDIEQHRIGQPQSQAGLVITKIEHIFETIADCILEKKKELVIQLKTKSKAKETNENLNIEIPEEKIRNVTFPSRKPREAWRFAVLLRILELSHEALVTGIVITKRFLSQFPNNRVLVETQSPRSNEVNRDVYYKEPELFKHQSVVDRYLNDIAFTFGVERDALNVVAAAKGLVAGSFTVTQYGCASIDCSQGLEGVLVPSCEKIKNIITYDVCWILVIEKEATFRTLVSSLYWKNSLAGKGILITAKGYPDIQTRRFLHCLHTRYTKTPIYALMDFDPDGIGIMATYKHGSMNSVCQKNINIPTIEWLGIKSHDFLRKKITLQGLQNLSGRDRRLASAMIERAKDLEWKSELQIMLMLNLKAEIQILGGADLLCRWLDFNLLN